jgi:RNA polymerase sigma factor (sigma-70 family)
MIDKQIWKNIIDGDQLAYKQLYTYYFRKFYNYGRKFTSNEFLIEDSIQEVFLEIWNKREKLFEIESENSYFFSAFRFMLLKKIRAAGNTRQLDRSEEEADFSVEQLIIEKELDEELKEKVRLALGALTSRQREAIFLRFYEGLSYEEVAKVLNITVKASYKIMARSLQTLREQLHHGVIPLLFLFGMFKC